MTRTSAAVTLALLSLDVAACAGPRPVSGAVPNSHENVGSADVRAPHETEQADVPRAVVPEPKTGTCTATLKVVPLGRSGASCHIAEEVAGQNGTLTYPCAGGRAEATFGSYVFQGFITDGKIDLLLSTSFDFTDGCKWRSRQRVQGSVASGELGLDYEEAPEPGQKSCASACTAGARVKVTR
jgi:hypothetical protein